jgi:hypothetical protein
MSNAPVDVSKWNLFAALPVALIAACGPVVGNDTSAAIDDGTDSDPTNPTDPSDPTTPETTINPTGPVECYVDADCGYAFDCIDGQCVYDYDCYCGQCPYYADPLPPGFDPRCSPPLDCYSDADCAYGEVCRYNYCEPPEDACDGFIGIPVIESTIDVVFGGDAGLTVGAIAVGDVAPSAGVEILVARGSQIEVVVDGEGTLVAGAGAPVVALATGDVDGDGQLDIIAATDTAVQVWLVVDGILSSSLSQPAIGVRTIAVGDRTGDGFPDVFARAGEAVLIFPGAMGQPLGVAEPIVVEGVREFAAVDAEGGAYTIGYTEASYIESMLPADFSGDGVVDLVAVGRDPSSMATITGPILASNAYVTPQSEQIADAAAGAVDGDGFADLALLLDGTGVVRVRFGAQGLVGEFGKGEPFGCLEEYASGVIGSRVVLADTLGDGTVDIVVSDNVAVRVLRLGSGI